MVDVLVKKWVFAKKFEGDARQENFKLIEEKLETNMKDGEMFTEAEFIAVDPYLRVLESKSKAFSVGSYVMGELGWRTNTICDESKVENLPEVGDLPVSSALGIYGMSGMTAYFGIHDVLDPKSGEVFFVSSAAGSVGNLAGQIAKIKGCKVIGSAGSQEKCDWLTKELGFDHVFNYKTTKLEDAVSEFSPSGIDCYFDNVGGEFTTAMIRHIRPNGRIYCCGSISTYNDDENQPKGPYPWYYICQQNIRIEGKDVRSVRKDRYIQAQQQMLQWVQQGKLKYREHITTGFENIPTAFLELFHGKTIGKAVVKV
ncbi:prostaglandin reductase 1-like isoform X2 [Mercenaria mercenaria]|uniref:prostaglandin reductase 1-like isoform X2 n=1 Tax=Mercenaria mercenaria TaxID=6596 RepID=UPI00234F32C5|nr:prostaglandin reductase 1-like isoform X2 [Mercenaria mercenaria]